MTSKTLTRRDLLAAFLGVTAAAAACRRGEPAAVPPGELVGATPEFGHLLRSAAQRVPAEWQRKRVAVVGGGIAGLSAAWRLRRRGITDVVVLELEDDVGGTSRSGSAPFVRFPWGAHYIPVPPKENRELVALLDELNVLERIEADGTPVVREEQLCRDPQERLFFRGRWSEGMYLHAGETAADVVQLARFHREMVLWSRWRDSRGRAAFCVPSLDASDDTEVMSLDRITMARWLSERGFDSSRLRWLVDYSCRDDYGLTLEQTSAWAGIFYFASRLDGSGNEAPLITWPEGNARFVDHFRASLGRSVLSRRLVTRVEPGVTTRVSAMDRQGRVEGFEVDRVIFAAPQFIARRVVAGLEQRDEFQYGAWMVANLWLRDRPVERGFPLSWDNVLYESPSLGYVAATHQALIDHGPTVFTYYFPLTDEPAAARERLLRTTRADWCDVVLADLQRAHPDIRQLTLRLDVARWGHAMVQPRVGFVSSPARRAAALPLGPVHFAHSDLSGLALFEEAFARGVGTADAVFSELAG